jgi:hypothetical protein
MGLMTLDAQEMFLSQTEEKKQEEAARQEGGRSLPSTLSMHTVQDYLPPSPTPISSICFIKKEKDE